MWFLFPEGSDRISVQQQEFASEFVDADGRQYFRAPDHFAGIILDQPGFRSVKPPEGAPEDLPLADPLRDGAIGQLGSQVDALKLENTSLKAANTELKATNADLNSKLSVALEEVKILRKPEEGKVKS